MPPPKRLTQKPTTKAVPANSDGITYLGDKATITVSRSLKLSRQYQGAGFNIGFSFDTPASEADVALKKASEKLDLCCVEELRKVSEILDQINSGNE